ncbi:hypothetical protein CYLTODRAFT_391787 [Cylindrobasidium torrendii FP15055 ss-10]|uniref:Uncharacterized protein n=1 Tax=Cylindrobasidium torrendii FP15055 ss-10 TaxID=1314674 RepID=A0A0D7BM25_9AGAR|nr:hypothetical protein CYLTODRAFT_391787 [Cylindrobasidium torrendii FP15055 ss-10]
MFLHPVYLATLLVGALAAPHEERSGTKLTQAQAEARLVPENIIAYSTGGCTTKTVSTCTSYDGIYSGTVDGVITLKNAAGVSGLTITGGTEVGHASGTYSHSNGYKVDVRHQTGLDNYIHNTFTKIANRADGYPQWQAASGNLYCVGFSSITSCFRTSVMHRMRETIGILHTFEGCSRYLSDQPCPSAY